MNETPLSVCTVMLRIYVCMYVSKYVDVSNSFCPSGSCNPSLTGMVDELLSHEGQQPPCTCIRTYIHTYMYILYRYYFPVATCHSKEEFYSIVFSLVSFTITRQHIHTYIHNILETSAVENRLGCAPAKTVHRWKGNCFKI